jgi:hypothetical protein
MVLDSAIDALVSTGLRAELQETGKGRAHRGAALLHLSADRITQTFVVEQRRRAPYISELLALIARQVDAGSDGMPMLVAPYVSASLGDALIEAGWSWADANGNFDIRASGLRWRQRLTSGPSRRRRARLPQGNAGTAIVRWLLTSADVTAPIRQSELAEIAGVSQPRVSQILSRLVDLDYVIREGRQLRLGSPEPLLDQFVEEPALLRGEVFYGSSAAPLRDVARVALQIGDRVAVSADIGLERLASYRQATHVVFYGAQRPNWGKLAAEESPPDSATLIWRVPEDRTILGTTQSGTCGGGELRCVDAVQLMVDLRELGGADRLKAADVLRSWFLKTRGRSK